MEIYFINNEDYDQQSTHWYITVAPVQPHLCQRRCQELKDALLMLVSQIERYMEIYECQCTYHNLHSTGLASVPSLRADCCYGFIC